MADTQNTAAATADGTGNEPTQQVDAPSKDWESEYRKAVEQSRKWEARAKANSSAAKELDEMKKASMSDADKLADAEQRAKAAEDELQALRDAAQRRVDADEVSTATGVPAALLTADTSTKDGMLAFAKHLAEWAGERQNYPSIHDAGRQAPETKKHSAMESFGDFIAAQMK